MAVFLPVTFPMFTVSGVRELSTHHTLPSLSFSLEKIF